MGNGFLVLCFFEHRVVCHQVGGDGLYGLSLDVAGFQIAEDAVVDDGELMQLVFGEHGFVFVEVEQHLHARKDLVARD